MRVARQLRGALLLLVCLGVASQAAAGKKDKKAQASSQDGGPRITILHKPGTPAEHLITINIRALEAHLAHGDELYCAAPGGGDLMLDRASGLFSYAAVNCSLALVLDILTVPVRVPEAPPLLCQAILDQTLPENDPLPPVSSFSDGDQPFLASELFGDGPAGAGFDPDGPYAVMAYYSCVVNDN